MQEAIRLRAERDWWLEAYDEMEGEAHKGLTDLQEANKRLAKQLRVSQHSI
jgi:hypothetical protein